METASNHGASPNEEGDDLEGLSASLREKGSAVDPPLDSLNLEIPFSYEVHGHRHEDPFQYLEAGSESSRTVAFVERQNLRTREFLDDERFQKHAESMSARFGGTPSPSYRDPVSGGTIRLVSSAGEPRGRLILDGRESDSGKSETSAPRTLLDLDALSESEGRDWRFRKLTFISHIPGRVVLELAESGADSSAFREFDLNEGKFVEDGLHIEGVPYSVVYCEAQKSLIFAVAEQEEGSNTFPFPTDIRRWDPSMGNSEGESIYGFKATDFNVRISVAELSQSDRRAVIFVVDKDYKQTKLIATEKKGEFTELPLPFIQSSRIFSGAGQIFFTLAENFEVDGENLFGSLVSFDLAAFLEDGKSSKFCKVTDLRSTGALEGVAFGSEHFYLAVRRNVVSHLHAGKLSDLYESKAPSLSEIPLPGKGSLTIEAAPERGGVIVSYSDFITPWQRYLLVEGETKLPESFSASRSALDFSLAEVRQEFAVSADGTRIPFFIVDGRDDKTRPGPTVQHAYGGFGTSSFPQTLTGYEGSWISMGGVYVLANVRGGGEYGPDWHFAAIGKDKYKSFEDFKAVSDRLFELGVTTPDKLGAVGSSHGGFLTGNVLARYPETYGAVISHNPVFDMLRGEFLTPSLRENHMEFGAVDKPEDYPILHGLSSYHRLESGVEYPPTLILTSELDDRVNAAHGRKMVARMQNLGAKYAFLYEAPGAGHHETSFTDMVGYHARCLRFFEKTLARGEFS